MKEKSLIEKEAQLKDIIAGFRNVAISYSGGTDSNLLLKFCLDILGEENVIAVVSCSIIHPRVAVEEAIQLAIHMGAKIKKVQTNELYNRNFVENKDNYRCYNCKKELFNNVIKIAQEIHYDYVIDGTNFDDSMHVRPSFEAHRELNIISPLAEARLHKNEIRQLSKKYNLSTYDKTPYMCYAQKIGYGELITKAKIKRIIEAEKIASFLNVNRLEVHEPAEATASIKVDEKGFNELLVKENQDLLVSELKKLGFLYVSFDLEPLEQKYY